MKKRTYNLDNRKAGAIQRHASILASARDLFQKIGFEETTIEAIAQKAEVSPPTVYAMFKSKSGILQEIIDTALPEPEYQELVKASKTEPTLKDRLKIAAKISRNIYDAEKNQMNLLRGSTLLDSELKKLEQDREKRRYQRLKKASGSSLSSEALDILWLMTGRDIYKMLVCERQWSSDKYEQWLGENLNTLIEKINSTIIS